MTKIGAVLVIFLSSFVSPTSFLAEQKKFERVRNAAKEKQEFLEKKLAENQLTLGSLNLLLVAYKGDDLVEVYAKAK